MLAILAPGQGAQTPGLLTPWLDVPRIADLLNWWSAVVDLDLVHLGTKAGADEIKDTAIAQPLIVAAGLAAAATLLPDDDPHAVLDNLPHHIAAVAGHSVGELTASAVAGVLPVEAALVLVRERGRAMARAASLRDTGMTAILGGDPAAVQAKLAEHGLTAANMNGAGQIVAAGTIDDLAALAADPPEGARLRPLAVAGAFHTAYMASAVDRLRELTAECRLANRTRGCSPTPTARSSSTAGTSSTGLSSRSRRQCAGIGAWRHWARWALLRSSSCPRQER